MEVENLENQIYAGLLLIEKDIELQAQETPEYQKISKRFEKRMSDALRYISSQSSYSEQHPTSTPISLNITTTENENIFPFSDDDDGLPKFHTQNEMLKRAENMIQHIHWPESQTKEEKERFHDEMIEGLKRDFNGYLQASENVYRDIESLAREKGVEFATSKEEINRICRAHFPTKKDYKKYVIMKYKLTKKLFIECNNRQNDSIESRMLAKMLTDITMKMMKKIMILDAQIRSLEIHPLIQAENPENDSIEH